MFFKNPSLFLYIIIPVILNFFIASFAAAVSAKYLGHYLPELSFITIEDVAWYLKILLYIKGIFLYLFSLLAWGCFMVLILILTVIIFLLFAAPVGAPFYDLLSEKVEKILEVKNNDYKKTFFTLVIYPLKAAVISLAFEITVMVIAFPIGFIPLIGAVSYLLIMSIPVALSLTAYAQERKLLGFRTKLKTAVKYKFEFIGFGFIVSLMLMPPFLAIITFPLSVPGAVTLLAMVEDESRGGQGNQEEILISEKREL